MNTIRAMFAPDGSVQLAVIVNSYLTERLCHFFLSVFDLKATSNFGASFRCAKLLDQFSFIIISMSHFDYKFTKKLKAESFILIHILRVLKRPGNYAISVTGQTPCARIRNGSCEITL